MGDQMESEEADTTAPSASEEAPDSFFMNMHSQPNMSEDEDSSSDEEADGATHKGALNSHENGKQTMKESLTSDEDSPLSTLKNKNIVNDSNNHKDVPLPLLTLNTSNGLRSSEVSSPLLTLSTQNDKEALSPLLTVNKPENNTFSPLLESADTKDSVKQAEPKSENNDSSVKEAMPEESADKTKTLKINISKASVLSRKRKLDEKKKKENVEVKKEHTSECEEDEEETWQEVSEKNDGKTSSKKRSTKKAVINDIKIDVNVAVAAKKKRLSKAEQYQQCITRAIKRFHKEQLVCLHKAHLLCYFAKSLQENKLCNMPFVQGIFFSLLPLKLAKVKPREWGLANLRSLLSWYQESVPSVQELMLYTQQIPSMERLTRDHILVIILRAMGFKARIVYSFQVYSPKLDNLDELLQAGAKHNKHNDVSNGETKSPYFNKEKRKSNGKEENTHKQVKNSLNSKKNVNITTSTANKKLTTNSIKRKLTEK